MNKHLKSIALVGLLGIAQQAQAITIDLNSLGTLLTFNGASDSFSFGSTGAPGIAAANFQILAVGNQTILPTDSVGDYGRIGGSWGIGNVTTIGNFQTTSLLTPTGGQSFTIWDGAPGNALTATITLTDMFSQYNSSINTTTIGLNGFLSGLSYSGAETDLQELSDTLGGFATLTFSFSFTGNRGLTQLKNMAGTASTGFNADLDAIPPVNTPDGGATIAMLGFGTLLLGAARRKFKA